jgi:hypothetical protein
MVADAAIVASGSELATGGAAEGAGIDVGSVAFGAEHATSMAKSSAKIHCRTMYLFPSIDC